MKRDWWKEVVVYQVYWRSFKDSNGDGYGDLGGVIEKLDYLSELGVDVIWLNPIYESPDCDNGYDISDYYRIMPKAGTMEQWERLLDEVHARGMKLIMDLVVNHTSNLHPWFLESRSSRDNSKRDWYIWRDGRNGAPPNNWRSYFTPSVWEWDEATGQYYFHSFATEQPDLNWANPQVRNAVYEMMKFWLDKGIDGFRMDAINLLAKPARFFDAEDPFHISYLANNPGIHEYLREMHDRVLRHYDVLTVGEIPFVTPEEGLKYVGQDRRELHTLFHFQVCDEMPTWDMLRFKSIQKRWHEVFYGRGWNSQFLNNHDHTRQVTRYGNDGKYRMESAKLLATMIHTLPGIPYIYQGEEIGMTGVHFSTIESYRDIALRIRYQEEVDRGRKPDEVLAELAPLARDNSRTPMQWDDSPNAGFTVGEPWIPVNPNYREINVEKDRAQSDSIFAYYKALISLRRQYPALIYGDYTDLSEGDTHLYMYTRQWQDDVFLIVLNHAESDTYFQFPEWFRDGDAHLVLANYEDQTDVTDTRLRAYEARIYAMNVVEKPV